MQSRYVIVNDLIMNSTNMSDGTFRIYLQMNRFAFDNISCFPSVESMAKLSGKCTLSIKRATKELRELGLIKIFIRPNKGNEYLMIPPEWISDRLNGEFVAIPEESQYIKSLEEFIELRDKVMDYYNEVEIPTRKKAVTRKSTTKETMLGKIENGNHNLNINEFMAYAEKVYMESSGKKMDNDYKSGRDATQVRELIDSCGTEYTFQFIKNFSESYAELFGQGAYPTPSLRMLGWAKVFNSTKRITDKQIDSKTDELSTMVF